MNCCHARTVTFGYAKHQHSHNHKNTSIVLATQDDRNKMGISLKRKKKRNSIALCPWIYFCHSHWLSWFRFCDSCFQWTQWCKNRGKKVKERKHFLPFSLVDIIMQGEFTSLLLYFSFFIEKCWQCKPQCLNIKSCKRLCDYEKWFLSKK